MKPWNRKSGQAADHLNAWLTRRKPPLDAALPTTAWNELQRTSRQIRIAQERGWQRAAERLTQKLARNLQQLSQQLLDRSTLLARQLSEQETASRFEILKDVLALEKEFSQVRYDLDEHQLCVTTDSIELEGVELGPFEIRLNWRQKFSTPGYDVVALEPNRPNFNSSVTHPHVQNDQLCEGEGREAIRAALRQGRFFDFFLLVSRVLSTYCADSAYASLRDWYGVACNDCGRTTDEDDGCHCERCEETVCEQCCFCCEACGRSQCSGCISTCENCEQRHCNSCLEPCTGCEADICNSCLEEGLCRDCQKDQESSAPEEKGVEEQLGWKDAAAAV